MLYLTIRLQARVFYDREDNQRGAAELIIARRTFTVASVHK